jgi:hypothetical protein
VAWSARILRQIARARSPTADSLIANFRLLANPVFYPHVFDMTMSLLSASPILRFLSLPLASCRDRARYLCDWGVRIVSRRCRERHPYGRKARPHELFVRYWRRRFMRDFFDYLNKSKACAPRFPFTALQVCVDSWFCSLGKLYLINKSALYLLQCSWLVDRKTALE